MTDKCYSNTDSISKFENKCKPMVTDNDKINYFLPDTNRHNDKRMSAEITQQPQRELYLMKLDALMKHFHYRSNQITSHTKWPRDT